MSDDKKLQQVMVSLQNHIGSDHTFIENELARVNREMYGRNVELAIRNQTLSLLRKIYEIINTALGVEETAKKLIDAIVSELKFQGGAIALIKRPENILKSVAIFRREFDLKDQNIVIAHRYLESLSLSLNHRENFVVDACMTKRTRLTNSLYDVLVPLVDEKKSQEMQKILGMETLVVYPIVFAGETFGALIIALDKHVGDLSRAEREALHELIEVVGIAIDRAKLYADLKDANEKLKVLDKLKDDFVSVASHELRTPMTAIKSYLWMAIAGRGGEINEKQKYYLDRAYNSTDRLIKLVNDMLNISRIESGRMTFDMEKVDLSKLVADVITDVKPRAEELGITINYQLPTRPPDEQETNNQLPNVIADPGKIKEVLFNLIGNSLKFTPKGGSITIAIKPNSNTLVECSIIDTGAGISAEDMEKLFQKFGLLAGSYTINKSDVQGTGLGLFITKAIIEAHEGSILAYSEGVGKGATFTFTLPVFNEKLQEEFVKKQQGKEKVDVIHTKV